MAHAGASPSWESMWLAGLGPKQAFDVGGPSATLLACLERAGSCPHPAGKRALVPGCGRAYDALALARHGFAEVVAIDLAPTAVKAAQEFLAAVDEEGAGAAGKVRCVTGDFFEHSGQYDFIWSVALVLDPTDCGLGNAGPHQFLLLLPLRTRARDPTPRGLPWPTFRDAARGRRGGVRGGAAAGAHAHTLAASALVCCGAGTAPSSARWTPRFVRAGLPSNARC